MKEHYKRIYTIIQLEIIKCRNKLIVKQCKINNMKEQYNWIQIIYIMVVHLEQIISKIKYKQKKFSFK